MSFQHADARPYSEVNIVGVSFTIRDQQPHVGLLIRTEGDVIKIFDFLWHHTLRFDVAPPGHVWDDCLAAADRETALSLAGFAVSIAQNASNQNSIPFGLRYIGKAFNSDGSIISLPAGVGFTCATFLLSVFEHLGIQLIDLKSWKNRLSDKSWQKKIVKKLEATGHTEHAKAIKQNVGSRRYRPEEVAVAAASDQVPVLYDDAVKKGKELVTAYEALLPPPEQFSLPSGLPTLNAPLPPKE